MGIIRSALNSLDSNQAVANEQKELVGALTALAQAKLDTFKSTIQYNLKYAGQGGDMTIPVIAIEDQDGQTHSYSSTAPSNTVPNAVNAATGVFLQGGAANVVSGICTLVQAVATTILGQGSAQEQFIEKYYVCMSNVALWRIDLMAWSYALQSSSLTSTMQNASAFYYTRSTVDVEKLNFQTFLNEYQNTLQAATPAPTLDQMDTEIDQLKALYNKLKGNNTSMLVAP